VFFFVSNFSGNFAHYLPNFVNMKFSLLTSVLLLGFIVSNAQVTLDYNNGSAQFQKIIDMDSVTSDDIYKSVNRWITLNFKNPEKVIQSKVENESVKGSSFKAKGVRLSEQPAEYADLTYAFSIDIKGSRVKFVMNTMKAITKSGTRSIEYFVYKPDGTERGSVPGINVKGSLTQLANSLISSLHSSLLHKDIQKTEDW
jgi:hypothetical protein